ncbi:VOC family protein [Deinococcus sp. KSM4-11]|uniref:VOC family protein n=1 Tax=Deinococcus sp. KSM4-11 TaxID=2568654 RepID=UPI0010A45E88|nr:VOC family protein [Deinococcus sp. KSM4-11]THF84768.1 VOC family protein [Deinococcus sp. KSM4-11]
MTTLSVLPATTHVGPVTLLTRDLPGLSAFYTRLLSLTPTTQTAQEVTLAAQGTPLLHLKAAPNLPAASVSRPGLYHTAFLLPTRADLGRWLAHAAQSGLRIGSGDHLVSEAFYLDDPEGNGIEIYADRPRSTWTWENGQIKMATLAVNAAAVLQAAGIDIQHLDQAPPYAGAPAGTSVGHIHLKVGSAAQAARWYTQALGLDVVADMGSAAFLSWGGYHHHIGLNEWHSAGQGRPAAPAAGLGGVDFVTDDLSGLRAHLRDRKDVQDTPDGLILTDPWGNRLTVRQQA